MIAMAMGESAEQAEDRIYGLAPGASLPSFDQHDAEHEVSGRLNLLGRLTDPQELAEAALFLSQGWLASGETLIVDAQAIKGDYLQAMSELRATYRKECFGMGADFVELDTSMRFDHALVKYLSGRQARF